MLKPAGHENCEAFKIQWQEYFQGHDFKYYLISWSIPENQGHEKIWNHGMFRALMSKFMALTICEQ